MNVNYTDLKKKEVVDISTGKNLGKISDLIINTKSGVIEKIIVPGKKNGFLSCDEMIIDFKCIVKIGDDAILYKESRFCDSDDCKIQESPCNFDDE